MREFMASRGVTFVARNSSGEAIGMVNGDVTSDFGIFDEVVGHINNAFVVEDGRRGGVGTGLVDAFEAWCRLHGATEVRLEVVSGNQIGAGFWHKAGYAVTLHEMHKPLEASP
jgi:GNAT superfamily N-acetyltransferase